MCTQYGVWCNNSMSLLIQWRSSNGAMLEQCTMQITALFGKAMFRPLFRLFNCRPNFICKVVTSSQEHNLLQSTMMDLGSLPIC